MAAPWWRRRPAHRGVPWHARRAYLRACHLEPLLEMLQRVKRSCIPVLHYFLPSYFLFSTMLALLTIVVLLTVQNALVDAKSRVWGVSLKTSPLGGLARSATCDVRYHLEERLRVLRGGDVAGEATTTAEPTLDEKVQAAMRKLGLTPPSTDDMQSNTAHDADHQEQCKDDVCTMPPTGSKLEGSTTSTAEASTEQPQQEDVNVIAARIAKDMGVDQSLAIAALGATSTVHSNESRSFDESAARDMIQQEISFIDRVSEDCEEVQQLVSEGHDPFLSRRALAFAEMNMDHARAILVADEMDAQEDDQEDSSAPDPPMKTVTVDADFDPTKTAMSGAAAAAAQKPQEQQTPPKPARKEDVVFDATSGQVQQLVLESPVPVLLDVYADWCGPCKTLTPILEEMAVKAGGMFRLVKVNSDNERAISGALDVTALPTVFGIRDGKILHMFQGMPRDEEAMRSFMMGLIMPGANFKPPVTSTEQDKYGQLSSKLAKTAGGAAFSFSARERLQDRMALRLEELVQARDGDMVEAEESAKIVRSLLSNVIRNPLDTKFRKINLENKVIEAKVAKYQPCIAMLKSVGFGMEADGKGMMLAKSKKIVNVAPLAAARDCIDKWIDQNRYKVAAATRKRNDEIERKRLAAEAAARGDEVDEEEEELEEIDPNEALIRVRVEGKKKIHELKLDGDDPLNAIVGALPVDVDDEQEIQITCAAKRLVIKSSDLDAMQTSLRSHGLFPAASVVVKIGDGSSQERASNLKERAAAQKSRKKKKGSHTMQSVGIYSKDDNAKGELIDGGGGVWYEHDVSDDEDEAAEDEVELAENDVQSDEK